MTFNDFNFHTALNKALKFIDFQVPTKIQSAAIPLILAHKDIVASAHTGSGKTAAFLLPALQQLLQNKPCGKKLQILILTPTRELASQITEAAKSLGKFCEFDIANLVGGVPYGPQFKALARKPEIVVATPGRLIDHIKRKQISLATVNMFILDEADRMLDMGFITDIEYIAKLLPTTHQTLLFSATVDKKLSSIIKRFLKNPEWIDMKGTQKDIPKIQQLFYKVSQPQQKLIFLQDFLQTEAIYKMIIFSATKKGADRLTKELHHQGYEAAALHSDLRQRQRDRTIEQFRAGKINYLIATDVAARGLDTDISHIMNYDMPKYWEDYIHRIGRTGRAGKSGIAISLILPNEMRFLSQLERNTKQRFKLENVSKNPLPPKKAPVFKDNTPKIQKVARQKNKFPKQDKEIKNSNQQRYKGKRNKSFWGSSASAIKAV